MKALAQLGSGPLTEDAVAKHVAPLFSRVLASDRIYLANHSLGRPLDQMRDDVVEATRLWESRLGHAWDEWLEEEHAFRSRIAALIHAPRVDCVVPKTSAGQGLRAVLNALPGTPRVLSTRGEFDSVDILLKQYAALGRIEMRWVEADVRGEFSTRQLMEALDDRTDLVVISQVMFMTGQVMEDLDALAEACHRKRARLLVDAYHAVGVLPVDVAAMKADFMIGGSYKYLRGGPGACFLYLSPEVMESGLRPLDTGWFAKAATFAYERSEVPVLRPGGDAFLEGTPPVLTYYQARSGQQFTLTAGVERLRAYGLDRLRRLKTLLAAEGIEAVGGDAAHGAFLAVRLAEAQAVVARLEEQGVITDARGEWLRLCPDCLTREEELRFAAKSLRAAVEEERASAL